MNIALTGFMGTGKTTVGKLLAAKLGWEFIDVDAVVEKDAGISISEIFARFGEPDFRDRETRTIRRLSVLDNKVFSCGGGAVLRAENLDAFEKNSVVVCLTAAPEVIYDRLKHTASRPLLKCADPLQTIKDLLSARESFYRRCSFSVNTDLSAPDAIVEEILKRRAQEAQQGE
jgi:shikimate kinase